MSMAIKGGVAGLLFVVCLAASGKPKIMFDADGIPELDGKGAVAVLDTLADGGKCEIVVRRTGAGDNPSAAPDTNDAYRKALAEAPDKSVIVCSIGQLANMRRLLESRPDRHSKLDGRALVAQKVHSWYALACGRQEGREGNAAGDVESARIAFGSWPTPIVFVDWNAEGRLPCWGGVAVFAAVRCGYGTADGKPVNYFNVEKGAYRIADDGSCVWTADENSRHCRLAEAIGKKSFNYPKWSIGNLLDELMARVPKSRRTDVTFTTFNRSRLENTRTGVRMIRDGKTLWNFEIDTPEGRPFFHPLGLPSGKMLTDVHVGAEPKGRSRVAKKYVYNDWLSSTISLWLEHGVRADGKAVLKESRRVVVDPPDPNGGYTITTRQNFTAAEDVTLECLPPRGFPADPPAGEGTTFTVLASPSADRFAAGADGTFSLALKAGETRTLAYRLAVHADRTVRGTLAQRPVEKLDRGIVASVTPRGTYVSWRLLDTDPADIAFDIWRRADGKTEKLNDKPIVQTSDFWVPGYANASAQYSVDGKTFSPATCFAGENEAPCQVVRLANTNETPGLVGVGDLDGDGRYDFVIKTPNGGTDPWDLVYAASTNTCRLEAYRSDGTFLWSRDHGWNIEMGEWYSPYCVADMDGDGKSEVVTKAAPLEPDYRDPDGRVQRGPEYLAILNGLTGETIARAPWPERTAPDPSYDYNFYASRNQLGVAYLDGKTPCAIVERGTYNRMIVEAFCLRNGRLERLWRFDNEFMPRQFRGQGDHAMLCRDVDGDGCDEVLIGSLTLDHDGTVLWCNGRGHSDAHYYGDIDPRRPGMEMFFVYETPQPNGGGLLLVDPATGEEIWKLPEPTHHVHSSGICADIDPAYPGLELYGQEVAQGVKATKEKTHPASERHWYCASDGTIVKSHGKCRYGFGCGRVTLWWDADLQREIAAGGIYDHEGARVAPYLEGREGLILDLFGDWREEVLAFRPGELRIYTTDIPAMDRRVTLMRDMSYRSRIAMETSGYSQRPILDYVPSAVSPNVSLRLHRQGGHLRFDVTAPLDRPLVGALSLDEMPEGWCVDFKRIRLSIPPGGHWTRTLPARHPPKLSGRYDFTVRFTGFDTPTLVIRQPQFF